MNKFLFSKLQRPIIILLAYLFACYSFADMGIYEGSKYYDPEETYKQYGVLPEGFITIDNKVYFNGILYVGNISCELSHSKDPDCGIGNKYLYVDGHLYEEDRVKEYGGKLYKSGKNFAPAEEYKDSPYFIEKINESSKRGSGYLTAMVQFIHEGVLYDSYGRKSTKPSTCHSYADGPVTCVYAYWLEADGEIYTYRLENKDGSLFSRFSGFEEEVYYDNDIRYPSEYCYQGIPYNNFKEYNGSFKYYKCIRWFTFKTDGPGWYSFWDHIFTWQ